MTVVFGYVGLWVIWTAIEFVFVTGRWEIIQVNLKLLLVGRFPDELMWLVGASLTALAFWVAAVAGGSKIDLNNVQTIPQRLFDYTRRFGLIVALAALLIFLAADIAALLLAFQVLGGVVVGRLVGLARRNVSVLGAIPSIIWHPMLASPAIALVLVTPDGVHPRGVGRLPNQFLHGNNQHRSVLPARSPPSARSQVLVPDHSTCNNHLH